MGKHTQSRLGGGRTVEGLGDGRRREVGANGMAQRVQGVPFGRRPDPEPEPSPADRRRRGVCAGGGTERTQTRATQTHVAQKGRCAAGVQSEE